MGKCFTVTITGADDAINQKDLLEISKKYSFVEWGILSSPRNSIKRFPSEKWISELLDLQMKNDNFMKLSIHLCHDYSRDLTLKSSLRLPPNGFLFNRIQVNCTTHNFLQIDLDSLFNLRYVSSSNFEYIFQYRRPKQLELIDQFVKYNPVEDIQGVFAILFDASGGRGKSPDSWDMTIDGCRFGYAGGINPENIVNNLSIISEVTKDRNFWIDMESGVRTDDNFDLDKVKFCLEQCANFIG